MKIDTLSFLGCILEHIKPETFYPHIYQFFHVSMEGCCCVVVTFKWFCNLVCFFHTKKQFIAGNIELPVFGKRFVSNLLNGGS